MSNFVYIAKSLDGYISDRNNGLDWLNAIPNPDGVDMGYGEIMERTDALVMGRNTFETVAGFDIPWPYSKPVFVLSNTLNDIPAKCQGKVEIVNGSLNSVLEQIHAKGFYELYIDGGKLIQSFLEEDLIDELILTTMPILLGGGASLFSDLTKELKLKHTKTEVFLGQVVQSRYLREK